MKNKSSRRNLLPAGLLLLVPAAAASAMLLFSCGPSQPPEVSVEQNATNQTQNETKSELQIRAEELLAKAQKLKKEAEDKGAPQNERAKPFYENGNANMTAGKSKMDEKDYLNAIPLLEKSIKNYQIAIEAVEFNEEQFNSDLEKAKENLKAIKEVLKENDMVWDKTSELENSIHRAEYLFNNNEFANAQKQAKNACELSESMKSQLPELVKMANEAKDLMAQVQQKYNENEEDLEKLVPDYALKARTALTEARNYYRQGAYDKSINKAKEADSLLNLALEKMEVAKADYIKILDNLNQTEANINEAITKYNANETMPELFNETLQAYNQAKEKLGQSLEEALAASNDALAMSEKLLKESKDYWFQAHYYIVKKGDCLWNIAKKLYGDPLKWKAIYRLNRRKIKNPHWIYPRQVFRLPWPPRFLRKKYAPKKEKKAEENITQQPAQQEVEANITGNITQENITEEIPENIANVTAEEVPENITEEHPKVPENQTESFENETEIQQAPETGKNETSEKATEAENLTESNTVQEQQISNTTAGNATENQKSLEINIQERQ